MPLVGVGNFMAEYSGKFVFIVEKFYNSGVYVDITAGRTEGVECTVVLFYSDPPLKAVPVVHLA